MAAVLTYWGALQSMRMVLQSNGNESRFGMYCDLFTNDYVPVYGTQRADLVTPTVPGYARKFLDRPTWRIEAGTDEGYVVAFWGIDAITFFSTLGATPIFGYFVHNIQPDAAGVLWAERFSEPQTLSPISPVAVNVGYRMKQC